LCTYVICSSCSSEVAPRLTFCANCGARVEDKFVGTVVNDRYRIGARIAVGGFGAIYKATQINTSRNVAIKIMHEELGADANLVARFRREGVVLCNLRDAHTVTTYELDETPEGRLFIVMELLEGTNLLDVFRAAGKLPWTRMFAIIRNVCSALAEAHSLGIVHRDLKPANIYLERRRERDDFVKVLDFGIAKVMQESGINDGSELTVMGQAVGTLEYMAPEQLMGGKCDGRTDIYTVGVVAYEMITGNRPFSAVGLDLMTVQLTETPVAPSERAPVPASVDQVILRCLEPDSENRYPDVEALARAVEEVLAAEAAVAPEWSPPTPPPAVAPIVIHSPQSRDTDKEPARTSDEVARLVSSARDTEVQATEVSDTVPQLAVPSTSAQLQSPPPRELHPAIILMLLVALGLGIGAAIAWLL
jgi:serine/threonine protein kinase